jgi:molybdenum cofactor cytidylyltransferase
MPAATTGPTAIILASGSSTRLGKDKLLIDLGGVPMLQRTVACYTKAAKVGDVLVVVGPGQKQNWAWLSSLRVHVHENPDPAKGMISTIRAGLGSAWAKNRDFLIAPADVPFVPSEVIDKLIVDFRTRSPDIVIPTYKGLGGHPGIYSARLRDDFFLHGDTSGAKEVLLRHRGKTARIAVFDSDICFDVDTEEDVRIAMDTSARWARVEADAEAKDMQRL